MNDRVDPSRRRWVGAALAAGAFTAGALARWASLSLAAGRPDPKAAPDHGERLVMVILRGGLDGLSAVPAVGDPAFAAARGPLGSHSCTPTTRSSAPRWNGRRLCMSTANAWRVALALALEPVGQMAHPLAPPLPLPANQWA